MSVILMYHSISDDVNDEHLEVHPKNILKHIDWLYELGFEIVPLAKLLIDNQPLQAALTFDDGYIDFLNILPLIQKNKNIYVTLFVCCNDLGGKNYWATKKNNSKILMDESKIKELCKNYKEIDVFPHGWRHSNLTKLPNQELCSEITSVLSWFKTELDSKPDVIAYPYGLMDNRTAAILGKFFKFGLSVDINNSQLFPQLFIPRIQAVNHMSFDWLVDQCKKKDVSLFIK